jgi:sentrin-specific protease 8
MLAGAASPLVRDRGDSSSSGGSVALPAFERVAYAPRQANGHDCGVYVMAVARALCEWHIGGGKSDLRELLGRITPAAVKDLRREVRALIDTLAAAERAGGGGG